MDDEAATARVKYLPHSTFHGKAEEGPRRLIVTADDYGIGLATSIGILELAAQGRVNCAVLLTTSPYAEESVERWRRAGRPMELGWHPCLTLDRPVSEPALVRSLIKEDGRFHGLKDFTARLISGKIRRDDVVRELEAQYERFILWTGRPPDIVNGHHHIHTFPIIGQVLADLLSRFRSRPFVRRVREPLGSLTRLPGARIKRAVLSILGESGSWRFDRLGFPGNDWLAGLADDRSAEDPNFFPDRLAVIPGRIVELMCHPGLYDASLEGRDGSSADGGLKRREREYRFLVADSFLNACARVGFVPTSPSTVFAGSTGRGLDCHAA